jgi:hypothetical protein
VRSRRFALIGFVALSLTLSLAGGVAGSSPGVDVRLTNDSTARGGYVSDYTLVTGTPYTDATLTECSQSRGRQNEPAIAVDPRNTSVLVGSSNDYCGVYNDGSDANGAPIASGPIWLGYYRSENGGRSFQSSLVPGYPDDTSPFAALARIRTATAGDPVLAWDGEGRLFAGSESSDDPAGTKKTFGDEWVATYVNPDGPGGATINDGKQFVGSVVVAKGSSAPNLLGIFNDKTAIEADRTNSSCHDTVYFANSRFAGNAGGSNIYVYRSTDHGASFSHGFLITTNVNDVQDPDFAITADGHVFVTFDATIHRANRDVDVIMYAESTDCGATFSPARTLLTVDGYNVQDVNAATPIAASPPDDATEADTQAQGSSARDCGDGADHCASGYTFFRLTTSTRSTADQYSSPNDHSVYVVYHASIPGTEVSSGTTFGSAGPGVGSQAGAYFVRLDGATGAHTAPVLIDPTDFTAHQGHQVWPDVSADGGTLHVLWWDSRNDPCYSPTRPIGNCADRSVVPALDVYATSSTNAGSTWATPVRASDVTHSPNLEQFSGRTVPFAGDYLWITSFGSFSYGTWTDQRDAVIGVDQREAGADDADDGADVHQCRTQLADGSYTGDTCPRAGGLDQNIYGDLTP